MSDTLIKVWIVYLIPAKEDGGIHSVHQSLESAQRTVDNISFQTRLFDQEWALWEKNESVWYEQRWEQCKGMRNVTGDEAREVFEAWEARNPKPQRPDRKNFVSEIKILEKDIWL